MAKPEWGLKRACRECGKRFYDFHRDPIVCPGCQAVYDPLATLRPRRSRAAAVRAVPAVKAAVEEEPDETARGEDDEEDVIEVEDGEIEDETDIDTEDDDDMIDDDDGIPGVVADEEG